MVIWDIRRDGHAWGGEAMSRYELTPEKTEMVAGKLYGTEEERLTMLALLLENAGADTARFFLEMAVRQAEREIPPRPLPSGYAALLYLYQLR